jgi:hypothetical protein
MKKPEENKGNYLSGIEKRVRDAVREEMVQLMNDGVLSPSSQNSANEIKNVQSNKRGMSILLKTACFVCLALCICGRIRNINI